LDKTATLSMIVTEVQRLIGDPAATPGKF